MNPVLRIEVFFDFICPWCLIGKRNLDRALSQLRSLAPEVRVQLAWRGVQLLPGLPAEGLPFAEFYRQRLGSEQAVRLRQAQVQQAAFEAGVDIDLQRIARMPNSADAHRLFAAACAVSSQARVDALLERLFAAYFRRGEDLGDAPTLLAIAEACGFDPEQLRHALRGDGMPFVSDAEAMLAGGVPSFAFDGRLSLSGAQPVGVLLGAMRDALERQLQRKSA